MASTSSAPHRRKAIVVGAGIGGISTAARLAHAGFDVEVFEKNDFSGGRCSLIHHDGYRFDQGPSLLLLPPLFHELYNDLGERLADHLDLVQCNPNYVIHYHDGEKVVLSSDRAQLAAEVEKWDGPGGASRLEGFLAEARKHAELSYTLVLSQTFPTLLSLLRPSFLANVITLHPFGSLWGRCARYFKTERMRRAFSFGSMYLGSSPFDSPGTYSLLQWTETCEGIWYPKGGFHRVPATLQSIAESHGAKFHFSTPIRNVRYTVESAGKKRATGVQLEGTGEVVDADVVVVNADLVWAYNNLFVTEGEGERSTASEVKGGATGAEARANGGDREGRALISPAKAQTLLEKPHSCSSISFYWAMDRQIPSLNAHNIFLAEEYKASFDDIFTRHSMPREPSFYVNVPSRVDPSAAPEGKDAIVVLVPVGHLLPAKKSGAKGGSSSANDGMNGHHANGSNGTTDGSDAGVRVNGELSQDWDALVERARQQVIETMEGRLGIKGLREMISWEGVNTPITWREKFNLTHGSILGITHDFFNVLAFRHQARHPIMSGAYFVGASAHPGTGVPIAIAGSKLCAQAVMDDLHLSYPDTYARPARVGVSELDRQRARSWLYVAEDWAWVMAPYGVGLIVGAVMLLVLLVLFDFVSLDGGSGGMTPPFGAGAKLDIKLGRPLAYLNSRRDL